MSKQMVVTNKSLLPSKHKNVSADYEYRKYEVSGFSEQNTSCIAFYEIPPGKSGYPYHYHAKNEEIFYIISGEGTLKSPSGERTVGPGDIIVCPLLEGGAHKLTNSSATESLVYLDIDILHFPELIYYPDSNKVGVFASGEMKKFYKTDSDVDYYEGE
ncbi:cupin domain-containing protein [Paenibacillus sp. HN-1]|uniref:cupin domain-containing protein n=1 Tax=Paenibacillus TaxID=44249 RepID=UPI001CA8D932|nr:MULTISPECIES: cupin domain-containing protein [Paenibacillus]MBY9080766.1 cupin domain-containing protein [Paenibacillus sp. CGMCC 1.18879]MBY9085242.1 cupin domain-containing protein [Paenibacillus sinensis]